MKLNKFIKKLNEIKKESGNLDVCISRDDMESIPSGLDFYEIQEAGVDSCMFEERESEDEVQICFLSIR